MLNFDSIPSLNDRSGSFRSPVVEPSHRHLYPAGTQIPVHSINPFAAKVLNDLPAPTGAGPFQQLSSALLLIRDYCDKYDAKLDCSINDKMTALPALQPAQRHPVLPARHLRTFRRQRQRLYPRPSHQSAAVGYTWTVYAYVSCSKRASASITFSAGKIPALSRRRRAAVDLYGIPGLPTAPNLTGGLNTQNICGFNRLRPPGHQSAVPESDHLESQIQLLLDQRAATPSRPASNSSSSAPK